MTTNLKDRIETDELETYKGKWRNVWFHAKGSKGHLGHGVYGSKDEALSAYHECLPKPLRLVSEGARHMVCEQCKEVLLLDGSVFAIQLPINQ